MLPWVCVGDAGGLQVEEYEAKTLNVRARAEKWSVAREELRMGEKLGEGEQARYPPPPLPKHTPV
jgi:hypothetical protein